MSSNTDRYFAAICPHCGKKHGYDKSEVCAQSHTTLTPRDKDEYWVTCQTCGKRYKVEIDCEGFK